MDSNQINNNTNTQKTTNGMAIAGFVISLVSPILCCGTLNWLSLIFSIIGLVQAKNKNGSGKGLAIAGIIISSLMMLIAIIITIAATIFSAGPLTDVLNELNYTYYY